MGMNSEKVLALDADGVLLDYLTGFIAYLRKKGVPTFCEAHEVDCWTMRKIFGIPADDETKQDLIIGHIREFSLSGDFANLPFIEGAVEAINEIKERDPKLKIVAITSAGSEPKVAENRKYNLLPIPFDEVHVLPLGSSKKDHLKKLPAGSVFVDDLFENVLTAEEAGVTGVLFRQPYNRKDDHAYVIDTWADGKELISNLLAANQELEMAI